MIDSDLPGDSPFAGVGLLWFVRHPSTFETEPWWANNQTKPVEMARMVLLGSSY